METPIRKFLAELRISGTNLLKIEDHIQIAHIGDQITHLGLDQRSTPEITKLSQFSTLKNLLVLKMGEYHEFGNLINAITNLRNLRELHLKYSPYKPGPIGSVSHRKIDQNLDLSQMQQLTNLELHHLFPEEAECGVNKLTNLETLDISFYSIDHITVELDPLIENLTNLRTLSVGVNGTIIISEKVIKLPKLEEIIISCDSIKYSGNTLQKLQLLQEQGLQFNQRPYSISKIQYF